VRNTVIAGVGITAFGKFPGRGLKDLGAEAVRAALADAGVDGAAVEAAWSANAVAGLITGQETIRGQVVLRAMGLGGIPVVNVENACAGASTALYQAWMAVAAGAHEVVLALGVEKMTHPDKQRTFTAIASGLDVEAEAAKAGGSDRAHSVFMETYAAKARALMDRTGATPGDLAWVAAKNHVHAVESPVAQYRFPMTVDEVLADRMVVDPLTRSMCSPIGDGAAAAIVMSADRAQRLGAGGRAVRLAGFGLTSAAAPPAGVEPGAVGPESSAASVIARAADKAYAMAGLGPGDVHVAEVHDATASAELAAYEELGFADDPVGLVKDEVTRLGGRLPVNTGGGLECRGHPVGATGLAQLVELVGQLRGAAGARQVPGARVGLAQNAGGFLGQENAVGMVTILVR
jgi:acetyl-CoA acetyltransferase